LEELEDKFAAGTNDSTVLANANNDAWYPQAADFSSFVPV
jgi:hypothetical protein